MSAAENTHPLPPVALIGLGPMGRALASALLDAGHPLTVWNRTPEKAASVVDRGAALAPTPADAALAAPIVLVNVVDHAAVDAVLASAGSALDGRTVVGLVADTPDRARVTAQLVADLGGRYLDGAIMTPVDTIGSVEASILTAGPPLLHREVAPVLASLATVTWVGEEIGRAAAFDVALLDLFWTAVAGYVHAVTLARAEGIEPDELLPHALGIASILPPIVTGLGERIAAGRHDEADSDLASIAASLSHLIGASEARGLDATVLRAIRGQVTTSIAAGHADDEISRIHEVIAAAG